MGCNAFADQRTVFLIGSTEFANIVLTPNLPCFCANCVGAVYVYSDIDSPCGYAGYQHGGINTFQIIVDQNSLCLNSVVLYLYYVEGTAYITRHQASRHC